MKDGLLHGCADNFTKASTESAGCMVVLASQQFLCPAEHSGTRNFSALSSFLQSRLLSG